MKHFISISLMMLSMFLASCSSKEDNLVDEYISIIGNKPTTAKNGVYTWDLSSLDSGLKVALKERTDKVLGLLPTDKNIMKLSPSTGDFFTSYIWEGPEYRVVLYLDYKKNAESVQLVYKEK